MPLVNRFVNQGNLYKEATTPPNTLDGDLWSDVTENKLKINVSGIFKDVGVSSFSDAATVTYSTTIGDYVQPDSAVATSQQGTTTSYDHVAGTGSSYWNLWSGGRTRAGVHILAGSPSIATKILKISMSLKKNGVPTGTATIRVRNDSDISIASATLDVSTLTTSYSNYEFELDAAVTLQTDYIISIEFTGGSYDNNIVLEGKVETTATGFNMFNYLTFYDYFTNFNGSVTFDSDPTTIGAADNAVDDSTVSYWESDQETNPAIYVAEGENNNYVGCAIYWKTCTETSITIRISKDTTFSAAEDVRTILTSALTDGAWNYIRWNIKNGRYMQIRGASGSSLVLSFYEIKSLVKTDAEILQDLGILTISPTDTSLALDGT